MKSSLKAHNEMLDEYNITEDNVLDNYDSMITESEDNETVNMLKMYANAGKTDRLSRIDTKQDQSDSFLITNRT